MEFFKNIWNAIVTFFTVTIPSVAQNNWLIVELSLIGIIVLLVIVMIIMKAKKKRALKRVKAECMEYASLNNEKSDKIAKQSAEYKELNEKYIEAMSQNKSLEEVCNEKCSSMKADLDVCKQALAEREQELAASNKDCQEKNTKIANMSIEKDNLIQDISKKTNELAELEATSIELKAELSKVKDDLHDMTNAKDDITAKYNKLSLENAETEQVLANVSDKLVKLEEVHKEVLAENDILRNYELENEVLLKTLRKFKEDDVQSKNETADAIIQLEDRLNKKIENTLQVMSAKVKTASVKACNCDDTCGDDCTCGCHDIGTMKRAELSEIAKKLGIKNFATWSNEKLRGEIKKLI